MSSTTSLDQLRDENAILAPANCAIEDGGKTYRFSLTTSAQAFGPIDVGRYQLVLEGGDATKYMVYVTAATANTPALTDPDASGRQTGEVFGNQQPYFRIKSGLTYLWAKGSAAMTAHLIPVLTP
jgi:hypothetical protein